MGDQLRTKKKVLLSKIETVYGTDPTPTAGANGVLVKNIDLSPMEMEVAARDNIKPYFGNDEDLPVVTYAKISFEVELSGSGTAGTAPPIGQLLRAASMSETILVAPHTSTAVSGGASIVGLGVGASAIDGAYVGLTINLTGGTGAGQSGVIKAYNGTTKVATMTAAWTTPTDNTSVYVIPAQVVYRRITDAPESITHYTYIDKVLHKMTGARGSASFSLAYKKIPTVKFSFTGVFVPVTDANAPAVSFSSRKKPLAVNSNNTGKISLLGYNGVVMSDLSIDLANEVVFRSLPGASDSVVITDSKPSGSITQEASTIATKNWWAAVKNVDVGAFTITHGLDVGNIIKIDAPLVQLTKPTYSEADGVQMLQTALKLMPDQGNDELTVCFL